MDVEQFSMEPDRGWVARWWSPRTIAIASAVMLVVTAAVDASVPASIVILTTFLGWAPLLAASALGPRATSVFAVAATLAATLSAIWNGAGAQYWVRVVNVAMVGALSVLVAGVRTGREVELRASQYIAGVAQQALLPVLPERLGPVTFATRYHSATQTAQVGGDFFDFVADRGRIRLILGDVSGKGIDAVTQAARVIRAFRQYGASEPDLLSVARRVDEYVTPFWTWEYYATAVFVEIVDAHTITVVSAGHPPPLLSTGSGVSELPVIACVPLGLGPAEQATQHTWSTSERLLLYTDGLIEARDSSGEFLPRTAIDAALRNPDADDCLDALLSSVARHAGRFNDDLALLLITNTFANGGATEVVVEQAQTSVT